MWSIVPAVRKLLLLMFVCAEIFVAQAQQNFINVPSSEATKKGKLFFQQQLNFNELLQSNTTLDLGLGKGFEAGINVLGLNYKEKTSSFFLNDTNDRDPYNPLVTVNALKQFELNEKVSFTAGGQAGINFDFDRKEEVAGLLYSNFRLQDVLVQNSCFIAGLYYNTQHYGGEGNRLGVWAGTEIPIVPNFHLMAESVIGNSAICYTSVGVVYYPLKRMPLTLGLQIPNTKRNAYALVFELTFVP
jgi:hypothetical protein